MEEKPGNPRVSHSHKLKIYGSGYYVKNCWGIDRREYYILGYTKELFVSIIINRLRNFSMEQKINKKIIARKLLHIHL